MEHSVAGQIRERVRTASPRTVLRVSDFEGPLTAVESALSRLASDPHTDLLRVRKGLYWKTVATRFGVVQPSPMDVALAVAGSGAGPSGVAAAAALGLTTQVPSVTEVAIPGRTPRPVPGVRFRQRGYHRRELALRPLEVALLEVLREAPVAMETSPSELTACVRHLEKAGKVRLQKLQEAVKRERDTRIRSGFTALEDALRGSSAAA